MTQASTDILFPAYWQRGPIDFGNEGRGKRVSNICWISQLVIHSVIRPYDSGHEVDAAVSAPTDDLPCPGLAGRNQAETKAELADLLKMADEEGAEARKGGLIKITQSGDASICIECGKTARRDRVLAHVLYKHMDLKTWACPLWCACFHRWNGTYH